MGYKIHIFVIMSLERSEKIAKERECALNFVRHLVLVSLQWWREGVVLHGLHSTLSHPLDSLHRERPSGPAPHPLSETDSSVNDPRAAEGGVLRRRAGPADGTA